MPTQPLTWSSQACLRSPAASADNLSAAREPHSSRRVTGTRNASQLGWSWEIHHCQQTKEIRSPAHCLSPWGPRDSGVTVCIRHGDSAQTHKGCTLRVRGSIQWLPAIRHLTDPHGYVRAWIRHLEAERSKDGSSSAGQVRSKMGGHASFSAAGVPRELE